jgi:PBP1b-binding outer membrane lipoprotein LpoB
MKYSVCIFALLLAGCSSKPDANSPAVKSKQRKVLEQQQKGFSESMKDFRFPDPRKAPEKTRAKAPVSGTAGQQTNRK